MGEYLIEILLYYQLSQIFLASIPGIIAGVLGIVGGFIGVLYSDHLARKREEDRWNKQREIEMEGWKRQRELDEDRWRKQIEWDKKKQLIELRNTYIMPLILLSTNYYGLDLKLRTAHDPGVELDEREIRNLYAEYTKTIFELGNGATLLLKTGVLPLMLDSKQKIDIEVFGFLRTLEFELHSINRDDFIFENVNNFKFLGNQIHNYFIELPDILNCSSHELC